MLLVLKILTDTGTNKIMNQVRYYTTNEVVIHNKTDDIWVIINNVIFNLTRLIENRLYTINDVSCIQ